MGWCTPHSLRPQTWIHWRFSASEHCDFWLGLANQMTSEARVLSSTISSWLVCCTGEVLKQSVTSHFKMPWLKLVVTCWLIISCNVPAIWAVRTAGCVTSAAGQCGAIPAGQLELEVLQHSRTWQSSSSCGLALEKSSASISITFAACDSSFSLSCVYLHFSHWLLFVLSPGQAGKCGCWF